MKQPGAHAGNTTPGTPGGLRRVGIPTPACGLGASLLLLLPLLLGAGASAEELEDPARIQAAALQFARALPMELPGRRDLQVATLDPRMRLPRCTEPLTSSASPGASGSGQVTVAIACAGDRNWSLYVPVQARYHLPVVVAQFGLSRGDVISADDLRLEERQVSRADQGLVLDPDDAIGQQARRPIAAGSLLRSNLLAPVDVIHRGDRVSIDSVHQGFRVRMQGESLQDAAAGERVRVRNLSSRRIVEGVAAADGSVRIMR